VFAFDLYDKNADGILEVKDVQTLFRELLSNKAVEQEANQM
jgi:Ca2+-binding EF-hand superfamily protein